VIPTFIGLINATEGPVRLNNLETCQMVVETVEACTMRLGYEAEACPSMLLVYNLIDAEKPR